MQKNQEEKNVHTERKHFLLISYSVHGDRLHMLHGVILNSTWTLCNFFWKSLSPVQHLLPCFVQIVVVIPNSVLCYCCCTQGFQWKCSVAEGNLYPHFTFTKTKDQTEQLRSSFMLSQALLDGCKGHYATLYL